MRNYIILFFLVLGFLFGCGENRAPDGILQKPQMVNVLTEVHLVDGSLINLSQTPDTLYKYGTARYLAVFKKYHTDSAQFKKSYKYYTLTPAVLADIYDKVLAKLQQKSDSVNKVISASFKKRNRNLINKNGAGNTGVGFGTKAGTLPAGAGPHAINPRPGMIMPQNAIAIQKFQARRDSMLRLKQRIKEKNALPKK